MQQTSIKNDTLLFSLVQRLHSNPSSLWARVLLQKDNSNIGRHFLSHSRTWRNICRAWKLCRDLIQWSAYNGHKVDFWKDRWVPSHLPLFSIIQGPLTNPCPSLQLSSFWKNRVWNLESLPFSIPRSIKSSILNSFMLNIQNHADTPLWLPSGNRVFSCKTAYHYLISQRQHSSHSYPHFGWI